MYGVLPLFRILVYYCNYLYIYIYFVWEWCLPSFDCCLHLDGAQETFQNVCTFNNTFPHQMLVTQSHQRVIFMTKLFCIPWKAEVLLMIENLNFLGGS